MINNKNWALDKSKTFMIPSSKILKRPISLNHLQSWNGMNI